MYRYFLVHDNHLPTEDDEYGHYHYISLGSHGNSGKGWHLLVLHDEHIEPAKNWRTLPKAVDNKTPIAAKINAALLADIGLTGDETTLEASEKLAAIFPPFRHP